MSHQPPTPPTELPADIIETLNECSSEQLKHVAQYTKRLAEHKTREACLKENSVENQTDDLPDDVPSKATVTIKEINDNRYYYWQWRDDDKIKSKYKGPVSPND